MPYVRALSLLAALFCLRPSSARADEVTAAYAFTNALAIGSVGRSGRNTLHTDAIEQAIVSGNWRPPGDGDVVTRADGTNRTWRAISADKDGNFSGAELRGGYVYCTWVLEKPETLLLHAAGHNMVYVNGEPRTGDPYSNGMALLPVALHAGTNEFLFNVGRGRLNATLIQPKSPVLLNLRDTTLPDILANEAGPLWGGLVVINASMAAATNLVVSSEHEGSGATVTHLPAIPPLSLRKVPVRFDRPMTLSASNTCAFTLHLSSSNRVQDTATISLRVRKASDHYKQTFHSEIDGSIQYFAVAPANPLPEPGQRLALFLSTHGASVEAMGQADAYASKPWGFLVAPTNRRPYGFDWEDWGRADALEVLNLAAARFHTDPAQTYLTGHSMGGHGAWQLGVTFPGRFAAIAPSAGWISFWSYAGASHSTNPSPMEAIIQRASSGSDTLALSSNYLQHAIYILHGDADDNVPVSEARTMKEHLSAFHHDFLYHEQPGAGHWWGNACVDWPPIFNLFARHKIPADASVTSVHFSTANPGVSATNHWVTIEQQQHCLTRSSIDIQWDAGGRKFTGTSENVAALALAVDSLASPGPFTIELDGQTVKLDATATIHLSNSSEGKWSPSAPLDPSAKGPHRNGPFKEAFAHRMIFVYGTQGTAAENAWAYAKARYDAETWWYRGNGAIDVIADSEFDPSREPDRGVILYGHADNNSAWAPLLGESPIQVRNSLVKIGAREWREADLACLFLRPRPGSKVACVAAVSGSGLAGLRLTERLPYFLAGVGLPDCTVLGGESLSKGVQGVRATGYFGNDWSLERGEFVYSEGGR